MSQPHVITRNVYKQQTLYSSIASCRVLCTSTNTSSLCEPPKFAQHNLTNSTKSPKRSSILALLNYTNEYESQHQGENMADEAGQQGYSSLPSPDTKSARISWGSNTCSLKIIADVRNECNASTRRGLLPGALGLECCISKALLGRYCRLSGLA